VGFAFLMLLEFKGVKVRRPHIGRSGCPAVWIETACSLLVVEVRGLGGLPEVPPGLEAVVVGEVPPRPVTAMVPAEQEERPAPRAHGGGQGWGSGQNSRG
jgi:hypothetical protein